MEKSGRAIKRPGCGGLVNRFICLGLLLFAFSQALTALDAEVRLESSRVVQGNPIKIAVRVYGGDSVGLTLPVQGVPESFLNESGRKEVQRDGTRPAGEELVTVFAREWIAQESGEYNPGPFVVTQAREGEESQTIVLPPVFITVEPRTQAPKVEIAWMIARKEGLVSPDSVSDFRAGKAETLVLRAHVSDPSLNPQAGNLTCPIPENAFLETVPLAKLSQGEQGLLGAWLWTPLASGPHVLPAATLRMDSGLTAATPVVRVRAGSASASPTNSPDSAILARAFTAPPEGASSAGDPSGAFDAVPDNGGNGKKMERESLARRLGDMRVEEYGSLFPARIRGQRVALEKEMGIESSLEVPLGAWKQSAVLCSIILFFLSLASALFVRPRGLLRVIQFLCLGASLALGVFASSVYIADSVPAGVVLKSEMSLVPEEGAGVSGTIEIGEAVRILREGGEWYYAEASSKVRGWMPKKDVYVYNRGRVQP